LDGKSCANSAAFVFNCSAIAKLAKGWAQELRPQAAGNTHEQKNLRKRVTILERMTVLGDSVKFRYTIPSGFATSARISAALSSCSRLCAALTIARKRAWPSATVG